jgi:hypothetical protein
MRFSASSFFHGSISLRALSITVRQFRKIVTKIREYIRNFMSITRINDTGDKLFTFSQVQYSTVKVFYFYFYIFCINIIQEISLHQ